VGSMGFDMPVECGVWLQLLHKLSQVCWSVVMSLTQQIAVFLVIYSEMHYEDISKLLNKSARFSVWLCGSYSCYTLPS